MFEPGIRVDLRQNRKEGEPREISPLFLKSLSLLYQHDIHDVKCPLINDRVARDTLPSVVILLYRNGSRRLSSMARADLRRAFPFVNHVGPILASSGGAYGNRAQ